MNSEVQIYNKDRIRLNILKDVLGGLVSLGFQVGNGPLRDYASEIHEDDRSVHVCGKFNISEDVKDQETITIRPIMIDTPLKIVFSSKANFSGKKVSIIRSATKEVEQEYEISSQTSSIELIPQGKQSYLMKVINSGVIAVKPAEKKSESPEKKSSNHHSAAKTNRIESDVVAINIEAGPVPSGSIDYIDNRFEDFDSETAGSRIDAGSYVEGETISPFISSTDLRATPRNDEEIQVHEETEIGNRLSEQTSTAAINENDTDLQRIEREITVIEQQQAQLSQKKQSAIDHLEKIEAEYKKDYASLEKELEEIKSQMEADASIIDHYKDQDVMPIETIFQEIRYKLQEAENQIRFFIEAKQRRTTEIESAIKSNKKA